MNKYANQTYTINQTSTSKMATGVNINININANVNVNKRLNIKAVVVRMMTMTMTIRIIMIMIMMIKLRVVLLVGGVVYNLTHKYPYSHCCYEQLQSTTHSLPSTKTVPKLSTPPATIYNCNNFNNSIHSYYISLFFFLFLLFQTVLDECHNNNSAVPQQRTRE